MHIFCVWKDVLIARYTVRQEGGLCYHLSRSVFFFSYSFSRSRYKCVLLRVFMRMGTVYDSVSISAFWHLVFFYFFHVYDCCSDGGRRVGRFIYYDAFFAESAGFILVFFFFFAMNDNGSIGFRLIYDYYRAGKRFHTFSYIFIFCFDYPYAYTPTDGIFFFEYCTCDICVHYTYLYNI